MGWKRVSLKSRGHGGRDAKCGRLRRPLQCPQSRAQGESPGRSPACASREHQRGVVALEWARWGHTDPRWPLPGTWSQERGHPGVQVRPCKPTADGRWPLGTASCATGRGRDIFLHGLTLPSPRCRGCGPSHQACAVCTTRVTSTQPVCSSRRYLSSRVTCRAHLDTRPHRTPRNRSGSPREPVQPDSTVSSGHC